MIYNLILYLISLAKVKICPDLHFKCKGRLADSFFCQSRNLCKGRLNNQINL
jgi:hypothetical protein